MLSSKVTLDADNRERVYAIRDTNSVGREVLARWEEDGQLHRGLAYPINRSTNTAGAEAIEWYDGMDVEVVEFYNPNSLHKVVQFSRPDAILDQGLTTQVLQQLDQQSNKELQAIGPGSIVLAQVNARTWNIAIVQFVREEPTEKVAKNKLMPYRVQYLSPKQKSIQEFSDKNTNQVKLMTLDSPCLLQGTTHKDIFPNLGIDQVPTVEANAEQVQPVEPKTGKRSRKNVTAASSTPSARKPRPVKAEPGADDLTPQRNIANDFDGHDESHSEGPAHTVNAVTMTSPALEKAEAANVIKNEALVNDPLESDAAASPAGSRSTSKSISPSPKYDDDAESGARQDSPQPFVGMLGRTARELPKEYLFDPQNGCRFIAEADRKDVRKAIRYLESRSDSFERFRKYWSSSTGKPATGPEATKAVKKYRALYKRISDEGHTTKDTQFNAIIGNTLIGEEERKSNFFWDLKAFDEIINFFEKYLNENIEFYCRVFDKVYDEEKVSNRATEGEDFYKDKLAVARRERKAWWRDLEYRWKPIRGCKACLNAGRNCMGHLKDGEAVPGTEDEVMLDAEDE